MTVLLCCDDCQFSLEGTTNRLIAQNLKQTTIHLHSRMSINITLICALLCFCHLQTIQPKINAAALKAQRYLESQIASVTDDYVLAIASYALKLAGSSSFPTAFNKLNNNAIVKGTCSIDKIAFSAFVKTVNKALSKDLLGC